MSKADKIPPTPPSVVAQITQLPDLPIDGKRQRISLLAPP